MALIVICYASRTGTRRNLAALRKHGWRLLVSATGVWRNEGFKYCLDPGAWTHYQQGTEFIEEPFVGLLEAMGRNADFIIAPDIVAGGKASLALSMSWLPRLQPYGVLVLIPAQNGLTPNDLNDIVGPKVGIFLGGDTDYKLETMIEWGKFAHSKGSYYHVGRVNSERRIHLAAASGADSFDGTSVTRFAKTIDRLDRAAKQQDLYSPRMTTILRPDDLQNSDRKQDTPA